jgi:hypothetical protein
MTVAHHFSVDEGEVWTDLASYNICPYISVESQELSSTSVHSNPQASSAVGIGDLLSVLNIGVKGKFKGPTRMSFE